MTPTHHTPPEPGAVRSIAFPHMGCLGTYHDMLRQDVALASSILRRLENDLEDAISEWRHSHGRARHVRRDTARLCVARVERWRRVVNEAFGRLCAHAERREAA